MHGWWCGPLIQEDTSRILFNHTRLLYKVSDRNQPLHTCSHWHPEQDRDSLNRRFRGFRGVTTCSDWFVCQWYRSLGRPGGFETNVKWVQYVANKTKRQRYTFCYPTKGIQRQSSDIDVLRWYWFDSGGRIYAGQMTSTCSRLYEIKRKIKHK